MAIRGGGHGITAGLIGAIAAAFCALAVVVPTALAANASYAGTSTDGTRAFFTTGDKLVAADTDGGHIDLYQRAGGKTTLLSTTNSASDSGAFDAKFAGSSADGTHVFFTTAQRLVPTDTDNSVDVYERTAGTTILVSPGNGQFAATFAGSSIDGKHVFFTTAERLAPADTDASVDVYDRAAGITSLISRGQIHGNGAFDAAFAGSSTDGTKVFFETNESLVSVDTDNRRDVYQRAGGTTTEVSRGQINGNGSFKASFKGASVNGTVVFFQTNESLAPTDTDTAVDVYRRASGATTQVSRGQINGNGAFDAAFRGSSASGNIVFFVTPEPLASTDTDAVGDVYARSGATTTQISQGPKHTNGPDDVTFDAASTDGSRVFFSTAGQLVSTDRDSDTDIYERIGGTTPSATTSIVSQNPDTGSSGPFGARFAAASTNGSLAFFESEEGLTPEAFDGGRTDVFAGSPTSLALVSAGGMGPFDAFYGGSSANGSVAFFTTAERLVAADTDSSVDVYSRSFGVTRLISAM